jgi:hypothetical protein
VSMAPGLARCVPSVCFKKANPLAVSPFGSHLLTRFLLLLKPSTYYQSNNSQLHMLGKWAGLAVEVIFKLLAEFFYEA